MSEEISRRAVQSVERSLHALDVYLMTADKPPLEDEVALRRWCAGLVKDVVQAVNPVTWQTALESLAGIFEDKPYDLNLTDAQSAEAARWIRAQTPIDEMDL